MLTMSTYLNCEFPQKLQNSIKIKVVGAQFGAQFINQCDPVNNSYHKPIPKCIL